MIPLSSNNFRSHPFPFNFFWQKRKRTHRVDFFLGFFRAFPKTPAFLPCLPPARVAPAARLSPPTGRHERRPQAPASPPQGSSRRRPKLQESPPHGSSSSARIQLVSKTSRLQGSSSSAPKTRSSRPLVPYSTTSGLSLSHGWYHKNCFRFSVDLMQRSLVHCSVILCDAVLLCM
jgi:hypothetical protein